MAGRVLVVGGGIAGGAVAALLGRAGHDVTLVERDTRLRSSGSPVDVRGSALTWIDRLGVDAQLRDLDTGVRNVEFIDARGRPRARASLRRAEADVEISRNALTKVLLSVAADVADVRFADGPAELRWDDSGVDVVFESGMEARFDLVIGADGQHSTVRRLAFGPEVDFSRPLGLAIATVPVPDDLVTAADTVVICNVPGACMSVHPAGGHPVAAFIFRTDEPRPQRREDQQRILEQHYRGRGWRSAELLEVVERTDDLYFDTVNTVRVPRWSRGRVALLGDAASSVTILGEGCSMALAGAGRLADELDGVAGSTDHLLSVLDKYQRAHQPEVARKQRGAGYGTSILAPKTSVGISTRNLAVKLTGRV